MIDNTIDMISNELNDIVRIFDESLNDIVKMYDESLNDIKDTRNQINQMIEKQQNTSEEIGELIKILKG
jgi:DNA anti-recombination protein RmuC